MIVWLIHCVISNCTRLNILVNMKIIKNINSIHFNHYEHIAWSQNKVIYGVDEVGRGCLAGPLVTAAVWLPPQTNYALLRDSKDLSKKELLTAYHWLLTHSHWSIAVINHRLIDKLNIYRATQVAMKRAIIQLLSLNTEMPECIAIDAIPINIRSLSIPIYSFNYGESLSISIAAASIIAKVTRDTILERLDNTIPGYNLSLHKGYCTSDHTQSVKELGLSIIHRSSFARELSYPLKEKQESIFITP